MPPKGFPDWWQWLLNLGLNCDKILLCQIMYDVTVCALLIKVDNDVAIECSSICWHPHNGRRNLTHLTKLITVPYTTHFLTQNWQAQKSILQVAIMFPYISFVKNEVKLLNS